MSGGCAEVHQLFERTASFGRIFTICGPNVRKPNSEVAQIRLKIRYSDQPLLAQEDGIEMTLLPQTIIQKDLVPYQMHG
jgi:hypothetical protein